jgi:hypothetical protein
VGGGGAGVRVGQEATGAPDAGAPAGVAAAAADVRGRRGQAREAGAGAGRGGARWRAAEAEAARERAVGAGLDGLQGGGAPWRGRGDGGRSARAAARFARNELPLRVGGGAGAGVQSSRGGWWTPVVPTTRAAPGFAVAATTARRRSMADRSLDTRRRGAGRWLVPSWPSRRPWLVSRLGQLLPTPLALLVLVPVWVPSIAWQTPNASAADCDPPPAPCHCW